MNHKVVAICGSMQHAWDNMKMAQISFERAGYIVLMPTNPKSSGIFEKNPKVQLMEKKTLGSMHIHRIEIADEIYICNVGGYIGESTRKEIDYATKLSKPIYYAYPCPPFFEYPTIKDGIISTRPKPEDVSDYSNILFMDRVEAERSFVSLVEIIDRYGSVSIDDLYQLCDIDSVFADRYYGWTTLNDAYVIPIDKHYSIHFPEPIYLGLMGGRV